MNYDIIGDLHGQADMLEGLLKKMGYRQHLGVWRHPNREAIFVGDFVDRGPRQVDTVMAVRRMIDSGHARAVMGNHEFNAIAWYLPDPAYPGEFLRPHLGRKGEKNRAQHAAFLREVEGKPALHKELIDWFLTLPLWVDLPDLRVVHACWNEDFMDRLRPRLKPDLTLGADLMVAASREGWMEFETVEALTKGPEIALPAGFSFFDKDGHERDKVRVRWWHQGPTTYREIALLSDDIRRGLPDHAVPGGTHYGYDGTKPVFFGHYWMTGAPQLQAPQIACVDYSAGNGGDLVAYRWEGEPTLDASHFFSARNAQ